MDDADRAAVLVERERLAGIARAQAAANPLRPSRHICATCGDPIPEARRQKMIGVLRCTDCQAAFERRFR